MKSAKVVPFSEEKVRDVIREFGSPIYVYNEVGIRKTAKELNKAFAWAKGYKNYFAVKATPTPGILKVLFHEGMGFDCSSRSELEMVKSMGISGSDIFYTSNNTPKKDFELAIELEAIINIDDLTQIPVFLDALNGREYKKVAVRLNPGNQQTSNSIIGEPTEAKFGVRYDQLAEAYSMLVKAKIKELGLHTMVASNEITPEYFGITAKIIKQAISEIESKTNAKMKFVNLGGGFGIPYKTDEDMLDIEKTAELIKQELTGFSGEIYTENGRYVTGPNGYLISKVQHVMDKYKTFVGVDASMNNLMRPGMYGAYHHITVLGKGDTGDNTYDIVGSLCENNDKFAVDRKLPKVEPGDVLVIHDAGAHGHSMGFNYNGFLKSGEVLVRNDDIELIRRPESIEDYLSTVIL